ncbi:MAG TPA: VOC family protein [Candidatus Angelobacter sp.]|nr:VOC family protein [Candidatus Angelobacter sp.]
MAGVISRRRFLQFSAAAGIILAHRYLAAAEDKIPDVPADLDHILLGVSDLDRGIAWLEERAGVRAMIGGVHPGRGTRNALISLGTLRYLEIIAPDPAQPGASNPMVDRLRALKEPRLIDWAAHTHDLNAVARKVAGAGIAAEEGRDGSRARPDGKVLRWKSFNLKDDFGGVLPFFIEWSADSVHPSQDAPAGCSLQHFSVESPAAAAVAGAARKLGLEVEVKPGKSAVLHARIAGKKGVFQL